MWKYRKRLSLQCLNLIDKTITINIVLHFNH